MQIKLPNQRDYRKSLNEITQRNTIPWQDVFPDLV